MLPIDLATFLEQNRIDPNDWQISNISWEDLLLIGKDHEQQHITLEAFATSTASLIQRFSGVHSVRWRVKDPSHVMAKIVRKRIAREEKYLNVSVENYFEVMDDLVGVRALHLYKNDCFEIDRGVRKVFHLKENPIAYIRDGDNPELIKQYEEVGLTVKKHKDNYRSIHYILTTMPTLRICNAELQVRTIFEEGWSEIDHTVRYPNFPNSPLLKSILDILNGMAGQADDTGGLIQKISQELRAGIRENHGSGLPDNERVKSDDQVGVATDEQSRPDGDAELLPNDLLLNETEDQTSLPRIATPRQSAALDQVYKAMNENSAAMLALRDFNEAGAVIKAVNEHNAAMKVLKGFDEIGAATKAVNEHNAAMRALRGFDDVGAVAKALNEHNATMQALKGFDEVGAVTKALNEHNATMNALKGYSDVGAVAKAMNEHNAARRLLDDHDAVRKALEEHNVVKRYLDEQEVIKNALKR